MGRPPKTREQHDLEGSLYQHDYYLKRKAAKQEPQPADPALVKEAHTHRDLWIYGFDRHGLMADPDRARVLWESVREQYLSWFKIGAVDKWGNVNYLPWGWWLFDAPGDWYIEKPEGIAADNWQRHCQFVALRDWGMVDESARDEGLEGLLGTLDYLQNIYSRGRDSFTRPWTTVESRLDQEWAEIEQKLTAYRLFFNELEAKWQEIKAEREAWVRLGIINGRTNDRQRITKDND